MQNETDYLNLKCSHSEIVNAPLKVYNYKFYNKTTAVSNGDGYGKITLPLL